MSGHKKSKKKKKKTASSPKRSLSDKDQFDKFMKAYLQKSRESTKSL